MIGPSQATLPEKVLKHSWEIEVILSLKLAGLIFGFTKVLDLIHVNLFLSNEAKRIEYYVLLFNFDTWVSSFIHTNPLQGCIVQTKRI